MASAPQEKRRILVVDDEVENCALMKRMFKKQFEVYEAYDGEEALELARKIKPHVVITDQRMPRMSGVDLLARIRDEFPHTIRILATAFAEYGALVDAVNAAGVHHYFEKPFHTLDIKTMVDALVHSQELEEERGNLVDQLQQTVEGLEEANLRLSDQEKHLQGMVESRTHELAQANEQLEEANQKLQDMVIRDGLTGLYNHRYLVEYMTIELARSRRYDREFSVLFLDIDDFKQVNDQFGHQIGDEVLRRVAGLLRARQDRMRQSDFAARYGGEEFLVILPETSLDGGNIKAERIRKASEELDWSDLHGEFRGPLTVSIGVSAFPKHGADVDSLIKAADEALYEAKRRGKNCVVSK